LDKETVTLIASIIALCGSLLSVFIGSSLAIRKERRQLVWSKELDRFFALEETAGVLVEDLGSNRSIQDREEFLLNQLRQFSNLAGKFARYSDVRQSIRDLHNILSRLYLAKRDFQDEREVRKELEPSYLKFLNSCDSVTRRQKMI
jgi:hypothetical protein